MPSSRPITSHVFAQCFNVFYVFSHIKATSAAVVNQTLRFEIDDIVEGREKVGDLDSLNPTRSDIGSLATSVLFI